MVCALKEGVSRKRSARPFTCFSKVDLSTCCRTTTRRPAPQILFCGFLAVVSRPLLTHCFSLCDLRLFAIKRNLLPQQAASSRGATAPRGSRGACARLELYVAREERAPRHAGGVDSQRGRLPAAPLQR